MFAFEKCNVNSNVGIRCGFALLPCGRPGCVCVCVCVCVFIKYIHTYIYIYIGFPGVSVVGIVLSHSVMFDSL